MRLTPHRGIGTWAVLVLTVAGLAVAAYLAYEHLTGTTTLACPETGVVDCAKVTTSAYSHLAGIPVAYLGVVFFAGLTALALGELLNARPWHARARLAVTSLGMIGVAYLIWAEVRLHAICLWCTSVHVIAFLLFTISVFAEALRLPVDDTEDDPA